MVKLGGFGPIEHVDIFLKPSSFIEKLCGSGLTLTNNEMKNIMKVIRSLENIEILLKGTTRKISSQKEGSPSFLRPLTTASVPLMKNVLTSLAKTIFVPLGLTAAASATQLFKKKKKNGSGMTSIIISNKEMDGITKIVKSFEDLGLLIKGITEIIKTEAQ